MALVAALAPPEPVLIILFEDEPPAPLPEPEIEILPAPEIVILEEEFMKMDLGDNYALPLNPNPPEDQKEQEELNAYILLASEAEESVVEISSTSPPRRPGSNSFTFRLVFFSLSLFPSLIPP